MTRAAVTLSLHRSMLCLVMICNDFVFSQIHDILKQGIEAPEGQNDLKRMQLRELAALNGTLRDDEILRYRIIDYFVHLECFAEITLGHVFSLSFVPRIPPPVVPRKFGGSE